MGNKSSQSSLVDDNCPWMINFSVLNIEQSVSDFSEIWLLLFHGGNMEIFTHVANPINWTNHCSSSGAEKLKQLKDENFIIEILSIGSMSSKYLLFAISIGQQPSAW